MGSNAATERKASGWLLSASISQGVRSRIQVPWSKFTTAPRRAGGIPGILPSITHIPANGLGRLSDGRWGKTASSLKGAQANGSRGDWLS